MKRLILAAFLAAPSVASAHLMPEGQGSTRLVGRNAYTLLSIPAKALAAFDDDRDGLLSREELARHGASIDSMLRARVRLYAGDAAGRVTWQTLSIEHSDIPDAPLSSVTLVRVSEWDEPPSRLRVMSDLGSQVEFRAILGERTEVDTLSARQGEVAFFTPKPAPIAGIDAGLVALLLVVAGGLYISRGWRESGSRNRSAMQQ